MKNLGLDEKMEIILNKSKQFQIASYKIQMLIANINDKLQNMKYEIPTWISTSIMVEINSVSRLIDNRLVMLGYEKIKDKYCLALVSCAEDGSRHNAAGPLSLLDVPLDIQILSIEYIPELLDKIILNSQEYIEKSNMLEVQQLKSKVDQYI